MFKIIAHSIYNHPGISGSAGTAVSIMFGMIDIQATTEWLDFIGVIIKDIGVSAGATVAVLSLVSYLKNRKNKTTDISK